MCRLFGFRSAIPSQVHQSLATAENALGVQAQEHPDGWGVAYYVAGAPHLIKSSAAAYEDRLFRRVSGIVASDTVVAHVRRATVGGLSLLNSHPFQHGRWVMAHNGHIDGYDAVREELTQLIAPHLRRYVLGDTDSEAIFYLFLTLLERHAPLHRQGTEIEDAADALRRTVDAVVRLTEDHPVASPALTVVVTDGTLLIASRYGKELHLSTHKSSCPERMSCPSLAFECEHPSETGYVSHFVVSSEPLQGHNVWDALPDGALVGCDWRMHSHRWTL